MASIQINIGNEPITAAPCKEFNPPEIRRIKAKAPSKTPRRTRIQIGGSSEPYDRNIALTNVAESADVIKKIASKAIAITERIVDPGSLSNTPKIIPEILDAKRGFKFTIPLCCIYKAVPPKILNQIKQRSVGARTTPNKNSLIVRPLEIRAIKHPTKGAHETHHAQ